MPHSQKAKTYNRNYYNKFNKKTLKMVTSKKNVKKKKMQIAKQHLKRKLQFQLVQLNNTKRKTAQSKNGQKT